MLLIVILPVPPVGTIEIPVDAVIFATLSFFNTQSVAAVPPRALAFDAVPARGPLNPDDDIVMLSVNVAPVALIPAVNFPAPRTSNATVGVKVPIPTFPLLSMNTPAVEPANP